MDSRKNNFSSRLPFELTRDCKDRNAEILSFATPSRFYRKPPPPPPPSPPPPRLLPPSPPPSQPPPSLPPPPSLKQPPRPPRLLSSRLPLSPTAPSMSQSPSLPKQLQSPCCKVSYRHSGEPPMRYLQELISKDLILITDYKQIIDDIGDNHITHMELHLIDEMPPLDILAPYLGHLNLSVNTKLQNLDYITISNLKHLKVLQLSNNLVSSDLLHETSRCTLLRQLILRGCELTDLPLSLKALNNLQSLDLEGNFFFEGLSEVVTQLTTLKSLNLKSCQLTELPESLRALKNLQTLLLNHNYFSKGLPKVVTQLTTLTNLSLRNCKLTKLPDSLNSLKYMEVLDISKNIFSGKLPSVVYRMANLEVLHIEDIPDLEELSSEILNMKHLKNIKCYNSFALRNPPYAVCQQSLSAIKKYFTDLQDQVNCSSTVPVAVVGSLMAGKTSLIRSLKAGRRELTYRDVGSPLDETTKVFSIEKLGIDGKSLRFIDFGAHEVYHLAYQLALKEQTIPLIVVSLEQFQELSERKGVREATKKHCFDWLSHLYLASPQIGTPILALTHADKLVSQDKCASLLTNLIKTVESIRQEVADGQSLSKSLLPQKMSHVSDMSKQMFVPNEIFVFGDSKESISDLQKHLASRCLQAKTLIPEFWDQVEKCIKAQKDAPYIIFSDIQEEFPEEKEIEIILRYFHNNGKIFWFEKITNLSQYIFHQIPEIVKMIAVLFHHCHDEIWAQRIEDFVPFQHDNCTIGNTQFEHMVTRFLTTGLLDETILFHLLQTETNFAPHVAIKLLTSFCILYGPIMEQKRSTYIVPYFSLSYIGNQWETDGYLQLRIKVLFSTLPLPRYVFQLMTVALLNFDKDVAYPAEVFHNGTSVRHGKSATHLVHDHNSGSVTIQVSTSVEKISSSWQRLIEVTNFIINQTTSVWKAACPEALVYCAHCLFKQAENPSCLKNPSWLSFFDPNQSYKIWLSTKVGELPELVTCTNVESSKTGEPAVPKQLRYPCHSLDTHAKSMLKEYLASIEEHTKTKDTLKVDFNKLVLPPSELANDDSDLSDVEEQGYVSSSASDPVFALKLYPTERAHIQCLFNNIDKVYQMSDPVRGRAMIINNNMFYDDVKLINTRLGSEVDYENLKLLFKHLRYDLVKTQEELSDLTAEKIYSEIEQETHHQGHYKYQSFFLVLMSHGTRGDNLYDRNFRPVDLARIKDLLSPQNFPAMKGKPKVIIIQACSGDRVEFGDASTVPLLNPIPATASATQQPLTLKQLRQKEEEEMWGPSVDGPGLEALNLDDFFIMKAASETYKAVRSGTHGSWFIRVLVATFYKHSCHRDIEQLFKIIQQRVRQIGMTEIRTKENSSGACIPDSRCTFTNYRKMFLFPEFPPK